DPSSVAGLILANPPTCYETRQKFIPMYRESLELARSAGLEEARRASEQKTRPPIFLETECGRASFDIGWETKLEMGLDRYCAALEGAIESDLPSKDQLRHLKVPTLVLAWKSDAQHPLESAELLCEALPNAQLVVAESWAQVQDLPRHMRGFLQTLMEPQ
ncbi:unnamed protein product, partial [Polarella glacialis]